MNEKVLVARGYDRIAKGLLDRQRDVPDTGRKRAYLERLTEGVSDGAWVLDLGCGPGWQTALLSERFRVVGVDISRGQLALARTNVPNATFLLADMCSLEFRPASFEGIAAIYSIIHVPREEHESLLRNLYELLRPGGRLLAVLGAREWEGAEEDWLGLGATMWWSHWDAETGLRLVAEAGFRVARSQYEPDHLDDGDGGHLFVLAERPA